MQPHDTMATPGSQDAGIALNPYAAPVAHVSERVDPGLTKAGRAQRLLAVIIDSMIIGVPAIFMAIALPAYQAYVQRAGGQPASDSGALIVAMMLFGVFVVGYVAYQLYWIWKNGQTLGKKLIKIKIVRVDGSRASFPRIVFVRAMVPALVGAIPLVGMLFSLTDVLFIFGESRRCVHDYMADTIVINA